MNFYKITKDTATINYHLDKPLFKGDILYTLLKEMAEK